ncbi:hypothetical protein B566_EDAN010921 [Ephemera danica]|nr:hypothetical protein B566_EDAN010921 [Ephemera danica]
MWDEKTDIQHSRKATKKDTKPHTKRAKLDTSKKTNKTKKVVGASKTSKKRVKEENTTDEYCGNDDAPSTPSQDEMLWDMAVVLATQQCTTVRVARNVMRLLDEDNTVPFIARYRKGLTDNMEAEQLVAFKEAYEELQLVRVKAKKLLQQVKQAGKLSQDIKVAVLCCQSICELDVLAAPFKPGAKTSLAERARSLGLEQPALQILWGQGPLPNLAALVQTGKEGLSSLQDIDFGIQHIVADVVSKTREVLDFVRELRDTLHLTLESKKMRKATTSAKSTTTSTKTKTTTSVKSIKGQTANQSSNVDENKFSDYFQFSVPVKHAKPHQVMAINRGEKLKVLSVKICVPDVFWFKLRDMCSRRFLSGGFSSPFRTELCQRSFKDAWERLLQPMVIRQVNPTRDPAAAITRDLVHKFSVTIAALGNGTACREVETWLTTLIGAKFFSVDLSYAVVSEQGASIYSCSHEAKEEFPNLDPNLISSVSIARRLQEPLAELVKLEPKNLGVGMYQHDIPDSKLRVALDEVVQTCVSFVGVDLNTASRYLLRRVAGLSDTRAKNILLWREEHGAFICRQQLLQVKGLGAKTFEQCAGFVRVMAASSGCATLSPSSGKKSKKAKIFVVETPLDSTNVHPEAYEAAHTLLKLCGACLEDLGSQNFIDKILSFKRKTDVASLAKKLGLPDEQAVTQLVEALTQGPAYDPRALTQGPIFKRGLTNINELNPGTELSGCVRNVTHFGAFIDVGVGTNGLLHISAMRGTHLAIGNRVNVRVKNIDIPRKRIGLELVSLVR